MRFETVYHIQTCLLPFPRNGSQANVAKNELIRRQREKALEKAAEMISNGYFVTNAARKCGVIYSTLYYYLQRVCCFYGFV